LHPHKIHAGLATQDATDDTIIEILVDRQLDHAG